MAAKAIKEATGKEILKKYLMKNENNIKFVSVSSVDDFETLSKEFLWLQNERLVVKPDQLIKRRGKLGLIKINADFQEAILWLSEHQNTTVKVGKSLGVLNSFIVEPFIPHEIDEEFYVCIYSQTESDVILFHHQGGINIGDVESKALKIQVPVGENLTEDAVHYCLQYIPNSKKKITAEFIQHLYNIFVDLHFTYLEINPLVIIQDNIYIIDLAAKLDTAADFLCKWKWGDLEFPQPFGREAFPEEKYIAQLDAKTGASLKLTVLNEKGRIWTMIAGGGASVIFSDTICDLGFANQLANYGEYSGAPSEQQTYEYAKTILKLMTKSIDPDGKVLLIGGGIANFTNVAVTFRGIVKALEEFQQCLVQQHISIFVRRAGPNYQEGLRIMRECSGKLGIPVYIFGPELHMTGIVSMALGLKPITQSVHQCESHTANFLLDSGAQGEYKLDVAYNSTQDFEMGESETLDKRIAPLFHCNTKAIVYGLQTKAVQGMLDFDFVCRRSEPSVVALVYPMMADHKQKFYWGHNEILIPVYKSFKECMNRHHDAQVLVNFASLRSAYDSSMEALSYSQLNCIAIIAEGIPEKLTRKLIKAAKEKNVVIIGPATVGGIKPGCFRIGNTGGMLDNILESKLYRPGSIAYVSRSGGMSNELNNIIARCSNGVYEGIAIGGDRYPGSTFIDHLLRFQNDPKVKMLVLLGEVGGIEEYAVCNALNKKLITKPLVAWCIGTCAGMFHSEVQFGHAGACAQGEKETAIAKNKSLTAAGAHVPKSFDNFQDLIAKIYLQLVKEKIIVPEPEVPPPTVPMDYAWARELGLIRKPASFMTSICDERGQELLYAGIPITEILKENIGIGGVLSLLWFQRRMPAYACKYFEMCLMLTADHGPAVSGAHNTIVTSRAGKDLVSSLVSGLLTIGERFGGAIDGAAQQFSSGFDSGLHPMQFVNHMKEKGHLIMGIGHRVKSINNPDVRVSILKEFVQQNFPNSPLLSYAIEVEKVTSSKKPNLILNVDGVIGVTFVDLLRHSGCFTREEAQEYIDIGTINGIFVLGRSIGFIGHYLDQKRLKQGLYRHPWDDISYVLPENFS